MAEQQMQILKEIRIVFDRVTAVYAPGEIITGHAIVQYKKSTTIKVLKMCWEGKCYVSWTKGTYDRVEKYSSSETYFHVDTLIGIHINEVDLSELFEGKHKYLFTFALPNNIPCSFYGAYGHVIYTVTAVIPMLNNMDYFCKSVFTILSPFDVNNWPEFYRGINDELCEPVHWCDWWESGNITIKITSPSSTFVPEETIPITIRYGMHSNSINIASVSAIFVQETVFYTSHYWRKFQENIITRDNKCGPFNREGIVLLKLKIPTLPPSFLQYCDLIQVHYGINLIICLNECDQERFIERFYPIYIGTKPSIMNPPISIIVQPPNSTTSDSNLSQQNPSTSESSESSGLNGVQRDSRSDIPLNLSQLEQCTSTTL